MFRCNCFRCGDPFNYTLTIEDMPAMMKCEGCCVKLVQHIGTPQYSVRRTCTDNLGKKITFNLELKTDIQLVCLCKQSQVSQMFN